MSLEHVEETMLHLSGVSKDQLSHTLEHLAARNIDYGDVYFQSCWHESLVLEDSIIKDGSFNIDRGVGVRAISGEKTGFAYSDQINADALMQSATAARGIADKGGKLKVSAFATRQYPMIYQAVDPLQSMTKQEKSPC